MRQVSRQQAGTGGTTSRVELEAGHTQRIDAEPKGPGGVTGLQTQHETLRPFLGLFSRAGLPEIAIEIEVTRLQVALAVGDKVRLGTWRTEQSEAEQTGDGKR